MAFRVFGPITPSLPPESNPLAANNRCMSFTSARERGTSLAGLLFHNGPPPTSRSAKCPTAMAYSRDRFQFRMVR